jgi:hypothetical protein
MVMVWSPGFTVSVESIEASPLTEMLTVASWPACSVPEAGDRFTPPIRLTGSEIVQETGPPEASMVSVLLPRAVSSTVAGETDSVPAAVEGDGAADLLGAADLVGVGDLVGAADLVGGVDLAGVAEGDTTRDGEGDAASDVRGEVGDVA